MESTEKQKKNNEACTLQENFVAKKNLWIDQ